MSDSNIEKTPESLERRRFLELTGKIGFTTALVAAGTGLLMSNSAVAQTKNEEDERKKAAKYEMIIATAYILGASRGYPLMQLDLKENIQNLTNGQVYVKLAPCGQLGTGGALVKMSQGGTLQAAQHSRANFAP